MRILDDECYFPDRDGLYINSGCSGTVLYQSKGGKGIREACPIHATSHVNNDCSKYRGCKACPGMRGRLYAVFDPEEVVINDSIMELIGEYRDAWI